MSVGKLRPLPGETYEEFRKRVNLDEKGSMASHTYDIIWEEYGTPEQVKQQRDFLALEAAKRRRKIGYENLSVGEKIKAKDMEILRRAGLLEAEPTPEPAAETAAEPEPKPKGFVQSLKDWADGVQDVADDIGERAKYHLYLPEPDAPAYRISDRSPIASGSPEEKQIMEEWDQRRRDKNFETMILPDQREPGTSAPAYRISDRSPIMPKSPEEKQVLDEFDSGETKTGPDKERSLPRKRPVDLIQSHKRRFRARLKNSGYHPVKSTNASSHYHSILKEQFGEDPVALSSAYRNLTPEQHAAIEREAIARADRNWDRAVGQHNRVQANRGSGRGVFGSEIGSGGMSKSLRKHLMKRVGPNHARSMPNEINRIDLRDGTGIYQGSEPIRTERPDGTVTNYGKTRIDENFNEHVPFTKTRPDGTTTSHNYVVDRSGQIVPDSATVSPVQRPRVSDQEAALQQEVDSVSGGGKYDKSFGDRAVAEYLMQEEARKAREAQAGQMIAEFEQQQKAEAALKQQFLEQQSILRGDGQGGFFGG